MSRLTEDILPDAVKDRFPPENVSPAIIFLCSDEAKEITGMELRWGFDAAFRVSIPLPDGFWRYTVGLGPESELPSGPR